MTKAFTKLVSLLMVLFMLVFVAAGCGSNASDTTDSSDTSGDTSGEDVSQPSDDQEEPVVEEPTYDFGGRTIRYAAWWDLAPKAGNSEGEDKMLARLAEMEEKYNFKSEYVNIPWDSYVETFTASTLAGDPFAEISEVDYRWFFPGFVANGFLYPLSDLEGFDFQEEKWTKTTIDLGTYNGKVYGVSTGMFYPRGMFWWNKGIFEREGLPNLYDLVESKQWTWDKMLEIAKKATKDLDGDGVIDQWGLGGSDLAESLVVSNGGRLLQMDGTTPKFTLNEPAAIEALQFYQDLMHVHKVYEIPPDGSPWDFLTQEFMNGKIAMHPNQIWMGNDFNTNLQDDYGLTVFPMGPRSNEYTSTATVTNFTCIPASVEKPEEIAVFWDKRTDPFPDDDPEAWKEGYEQFARDTESIEYIRRVGEGEVPTIMWPIGNFQPLQEMAWSYMWAINTANKTPQVAIDEIAQQAQAILEDAFSTTE